MDKSKMNKPQPKKPVHRLHNIARIEKETRYLHSWRVLVQRNKQKSLKYFNDSVYGSKEKSLQAAIKHRDEILAKTDVYGFMIGYRTKLRRDNKSGISGVNRVESTKKNKPNSISIRWTATWTNEVGVIRSRSFSVLVYGEAEARQMAIDVRERMLSKVCAILAAREDSNIRYRSVTLQKHKRVVP